ncbi:hypothetical protein BVX95_02390 [archaeon D22]|nr:hypothetical protein BVX95_02390 [archaeon D22]
MKTPKADLLIESSFEVCNKVGGIYTVVSSKAALMKEAYSDYLLVGPYFQDKAVSELEQESPPDYLKQVFEELSAEGISCFYGTWKIKGEPKVILIDFRSKLFEADSIKTRLWESYGIDSLFSGYDFVEPMVWSWCVGRLVEKISNHTDKKIVSHFHEWLAGFSILYLKLNNVPVKTIFTTHATMLGRTISGCGDPLYSMIETMNPEEEAKRRGVNNKFTTERACANACDIFTTVSEITGYEAEKILGRKPEVLVLNGLEIQKFPTFEELCVKRSFAKRKLNDFLSYYFKPYYNVDLKNCLNFFTFGRNEYKNKGVDLFIKSLSQLNQRLQDENSKREVFAFFFIPCNASSVRTELAESKNKLDGIKSLLKKNNDGINENLLNSLLSDEDLRIENVFEKDLTGELKKQAASFRKESDPPQSTHYMHDEDNEEILRAFKEFNLFNRSSDNVKVILYPIYLSENDGILNMGIYDLLSAADLGVFPSYYEPWGYTPLESAAMGVPAITTDLAGFGRYVQNKNEKGGVFVLNRNGVSEEQSIQEFVEIMHSFVKMDKHEIVNQKIFAKEISKLADWSVLIDNYIEAHNKAMEK